MSCRIYDGYTINDSIHIGGTEFVIGHNPKSVLHNVVWESLNENNYYWGKYVKDRTIAEHELLNRAINACNRQERF